MARKSLLLLAVAASLGLFAGCQSSSSSCGRQSFFSRLFGPREECCEMLGSCCEGGPMMMDSGPMLAPQNTMPPATGLAPANGMPNLAPAPRLVPQPQAQPQAYAPTSLNR